MSAHHRPLEECDLLLIQRVRETPSVYDHRHSDFRLMQRKEEEWEKVANVLSITASDARRRWTCLRDRYARELKQMRLHPSNRFPSDFFVQMDFLRQFVRKRRERSRRDDTPTRWLKTGEMKSRLTKTHSESDTVIEQDIDESQGFDRSEHNYNSATKLEVPPIQPEEYSVLEETDNDDRHGQESFEEYINESDVKILPTTQLGSVVATVSTTANTLQPIVPTIAQAQTDMNYMVCVPSIEHDREQHVMCAQPISGVKESEQLKKEPSKTGMVSSNLNENEDDFFCKSVAGYLRQLSRRHKIKAKVEMYQILEKYILLEEAATMPNHND